mmetsp:Transcript_14625/g.42079  ORF Transcript_14625/g.42079 Transcript_14625/m.42079 type:complete len:203 (-) Transcript_14625:456-1064(-)
MSPSSMTILASLITFELTTSALCQVCWMVAMALSMLPFLLLTYNEALLVLSLLLLQCNEALPVNDDFLRKDGHQVAERDDSLQLLASVSTLPRRGPLGLKPTLATKFLLSISVDRSTVCRFVALEHLPSVSPVGGCGPRPCASARLSGDMDAMAVGRRVCDCCSCSMEGATPVSFSSREESKNRFDAEDCGEGTTPVDDLRP